MTFLVDANNDISFSQGDEGNLTVKGITTDKNYSVYFAIYNKQRKQVGQQLMQRSSNRSYVTFILPKSLLDLLVVNHLEDYTTYYYGIKVCDPNISFEDTVFTKGNDFGNLNTIKVYPQPEVTQKEISYDDMQKQIVLAYQNLLEAQYFDQPKARATIGSLAKLATCNMLPWKIRDLCLNVDKSVGKQLDDVGKWVGIDRNYKGQLYEGKKYLAYYDWNNPLQPNLEQGGYYDWNTVTNPTAPYLNNDLIISTNNKLGDKDFRFLIKLKIIKNHINATCKNIDDALFDLFGYDIFVVWGDNMDMTYYYPSKYNTVMQLAKEKNVLLVPTGNKVTLQEY